MNILFAVLPFLTGMLVKAVIYINTGPRQKNALDKLLQERLTAAGQPGLIKGQMNVILKASGFATRSLTAASTLFTSFLALLIVAMKNQQRWIWWWLGIYVVFSLFAWLYIHKRRGSWQGAAKIGMGEALFWLSMLMDCFGMGPAWVTAVNAPPNPQ